MIDLARDVVLRWEDQDPALAPLLREGGIDVVLAPDPAPAFVQACREHGVRVAPASELKITDLAGFLSGAGPAALNDGFWPGIRGRAEPMGDDELANPTRKPWVDANGFRIGWLKALAPGRCPALAYRPDEAAGLRPDRIVPYGTLELALVEARCYGGTYVLAVEPRYRAALRRSDAKALAAWRSLGRTARWLRQHERLLGQPVLPFITLLVDQGEASLEIANLMVRQNASPALEPAGSPPPPDAQRRQVVVAASLANPPAAAARDGILAHAGAGSIVVTDREESQAPWWRVPGLDLARDEPDREVYRFGRGTLVAYKQAIADPSDFALDVIDLCTHARRAVRTWIAPTVIATATAAPSAGPFHGRAVVHAINYGRPMEWEVMLYVQGEYDGAVWLRPEAPPAHLKTARRGSATEVVLPELNRVAVLLLE